MTLVMGEIPETSPPLRQYVRQVIRRYLQDMGTTSPEDLHRLVLSEVEPPLIQEVLRETRGNQSRAAEMLGITRNTLRSKMRRYQINPDGLRN